ncbi:MAG: sensor histidine kinase, partial [Candidatus Wenzhouxiangella sp. M2_3B_020]
PDFCQPRAVFALVLLGVLLALLLALAGGPGFEGFWIALGLNSLMIESVVLASCLLLCTARPWLARLTPVAAFATIFVVIQALVAAFSVLAVPLFLAPADPGASGVDWLLRNLLISLIASLVFIRYLVLYRQWQLQVRAEAGARLDALQARIRPHFLFNSLNTIANLIRTRPDEAEQSVLDLSDLLRTGLRTGASHTLGEELELIRGYLRIESQRLRERLRIDWEIDDSLPLDVPIPALLIQPLVENAVVHGIAHLPEGGTLTIRADATERGRWRVRVENPLPLDAQSGTESNDAETTTGNRMALANIEKRLELAYGERARLTTREADSTFRAVIRAPIQD